jgi:tRNA(Arg) A34 adenosine deaminase TadA
LSAELTRRDHELLALTVEIARQARDHGNHPFGALLVGPDGAILARAENTVTTSGDVTGHAETNLVRQLGAAYSPAFLWGCTLYASTEPCAMCAAAIYWANIGRVVFALSGERLYELVRNPAKNPALSLSAADLFTYGVKPVVVLGPVDVADVETVHQDFWD